MKYTSIADIFIFCKKQQELGGDCIERPVLNNNQREFNPFRLDKDVESMINIVSDVIEEGAVEEDNKQN